ncbi:flavodoxin [Acidobacteria bacterium AB60]|nr:flavodoxin [Acidobacteria bacterium AB60]
MPHQVLVAYATRFGSTAETAQFVAETLRDRGFTVECRPASEIASLDSYEAVVLAAALYMGKLHREARHFLETHQESLRTMPVALLVPGPIETREKDWHSAHQQLEKQLARYPWLKPIACQVVGGTFDPKRLGFPWKIIPALHKAPVADARDWNAIRDWAAALAGTLQDASMERGSPAVSR